MKKVVVFGGLGFLGTYLVEELLRRKYEVVVADIQAHSPFPNYVQCDIMQKEEVAKVVTDEIEIVYNLAGFASLDKAVDFPIQSMNLNVIGNMNVLEACLNQKIERFIYASSAYAMSNKGSFYGISKLASEKIVEEYFKRYGLKFTILRYGSVYSERAFENNYIFNLVKEAVQTQRIVHEGDGEEIREYIHASDAAKLSVDVIESEDFINEHVILTGVERMRRVELFMLIKEILNDKIDIVLAQNGYQHHYKFTPYSFQPSKSKKLVANPYIDMGQGILECIRKVYDL